MKNRFGNKYSITPGVFLCNSFQAATRSPTHEMDDTLTPKDKRWTLWVLQNDTFDADKAGS